MAATEKLPKPNMIDRVIGYLDPIAGLNRLRARSQLDSYTATKSSRFKRHRDQAGGSGDVHLNWRTLWELREISRELDRNNGLAIGVIDRSQENILGPNGFGLQARTSSDALNTRIENDWAEWLACDADMRGMHHGWQLFKKAHRSQYIDGDFFFQLDPVGRRGNGSLRPFEADRVLTPTGVEYMNGLPVVNGVAIDPRTGAPQYYFVANDAPLNNTCTSDNGKAIRAESVVQLFNPRRVSQTRGAPILTPVIREFDDIDDLLTYERVGAKLVAAMGFFIETEDPLGVAEAVGLGENTAGRSDIEEVVPASINYLKPGQKAVSVQSNRPNSTFNDFVRILIRFIGLPLGMPIELVLLDFSNVNFSSSRQLLYIAQLHFKLEQFEFACSLSKIYRWWLGLQVSKGTYDNLPDLAAHEWAQPGWPSPNPTEDGQAAVLGIANGWGTRTGLLRKEGADFDKIVATLKVEKQKLVDAGLWQEPSANPGNASPKPAASAPATNGGSPA